MASCIETSFEWMLPSAVTGSQLANHELEKYKHGWKMYIPERLTSIDENGDIYFMGEKIGNKELHPYFENWLEVGG